MQGTQAILEVGSIVHNRYIIERLLGKGGFGAVYLVRDKRVKGNVFALKEIIDPEKKELENFMFEGNILAKLDHPSLPRVYRTFEDHKNHRAYMLMDYVEGPNLEVLRKKQQDRRFPVTRMLRIMGPIIEAVSYLHHQQPPIIHRDIKPANIIVPESEDNSVLVDFGVAKEYDKDSTTSVVRRCSPGYAAPEQYARGTDVRTDIYALASTCYTLLTGQIAADALNRMASIGSQQDDPLVPVKELVPAIPQHISDAISQAMSINKHVRFGSVEEFWQAMNAHPVEENEPVVELISLAEQNHEASVPNTENVAALSTGSREHRWRSGTLIKLLAIIALVALLAGAIFGGLLHFAYSTRHQSPSVTASPGAIPSQTASRLTAVPTLTPTVSPLPEPTVTLAPTPSPQPAALPSPTASEPSYPVLASAYSGTIVDSYTTPPITTSMTLSQVQQQGTNVSGSFSVGVGLVGNGPFHGTVTADRKIQFTAPGSVNAPPLLFQGTIQSNGSMSGTYCSAYNNQCNYAAGGHGNWNISPS